MIARLSQLLQTHGRASLTELALALHSAPEALAPMLELLMRKGRVREVVGAQGGRCGGCCKCEKGAMKVYEWVKPV